MRSIVRTTLLAALIAAPAAIFGSSSLVLNDGQVIKGTEIQRDGDSYLVVMEGGNTVAFPAALVKEIKIEEDAPPKPPPGWDYSGPKTLAGPETYPSQDPKDQLKVMGPPTQWSKSAVDTTWTPTSAYDLDKDVMAGSRSTWSKSAVDTTWEPKSGFDMDKDVMAGSRSTWSKSAVDTTWEPKSGFDMDKDVMAGSRSTWSKSAVDTEWKPTDGFGFKKLSFKGATQPPAELLASIPAPAPYAERTPAAPAASAASGPAPWMCAEAIFAKDADRPATDKANRAASLEVRPLKSPLYASLGVPLYEAESKNGGGPRRAVFTIAGGECRLVGGDTGEILGMNLTADHAMAQDAASFNAAMAMRGGARVPTGVDKIDYAFAFVALTDPQVSGAQAASLKMIVKPEELRSIAAKAPDKCALGKGKRRKEERTASAAYFLPRITAGKEGDEVTFLTWSSAGGTVYRNTVVLARGGIVTSRRDAVASHVGAHKD